MCHERISLSVCYMAFVFLQSCCSTQIARAFHDGLLQSGPLPFLAPSPSRLRSSATGNSCPRIGCLPRVPGRNMLYFVGILQIIVKPIIRCLLLCREEARERRTVGRPLTLCRPGTLHRNCFFAQTL